MKDVSNTPNWMQVAYRVIADFRDDQVEDFEEEMDDTFTSPVDDPTLTDFERLGRGKLSYGEYMTILMLCRDMETTSIDLFRPRTVTIIQSPLLFKDLDIAIGALCPEEFFLLVDEGYRYNEKRKPVHLRGLRRNGPSHYDLENIAAVLSKNECLIFHDDMNAPKERSPFPGPHRVLKSQPIDAAILAPVMAVAFPGTPLETSMHELARLSNSEGSTPLSAADVLVAIAAPDYTAAIEHLVKQQQPAKEEKPSDLLPDIAKPVVPLDDLVGYGAAKRAAQSLLSSLRLYREGQLPWDDVPRGMLLIGQPGTGKTELARAMAYSLGVPFISASYAKWQKHGHLGDMQKAMAKDFELAARHGACLMFIDEMDAFVVSGSGRGSSYDEKVVKSLIEHLDGIKGREGVVIVGAANDLQKIPPVIWRSGRIDEVIHIPQPNQKDLQKIIEQHLRPSEVGIDTSVCAIHALGQTGADCAAALRLARATARNENRSLVTDDVITALQGDFKDRPFDSLRRIAIHECGHALAAAAHDELGVSFVRLTANGGECQVTGYSGAHTSATLHRDRVILLAGRMAEILVLGTASSGAGGDMDSDLAKGMMSAANEIGAFGLGDLGPVWLGEWNSKALLAEIMNGHLPELHALIANAIQAAREILEPQIQTLGVMADALLETGVLTGDNLDRFLKPRGTAPQAG